MSQKIYLKLQSKPKSIRELLSSLFSFTLYSSYYKAVETYNDEDCTSIQCYENKLRSIDDIEDIINTYFPETPIEEILHEIIMYKPENSAHWFVHCFDIHKPTICYVNDERKQSQVGDHLYSFEDKTMFSSRYYEIKGWDGLLKKLNITNRKELDEYIEKHKKVETVNA